MTALLDRLADVAAYVPGRAPAVGPEGKLSANEAPLGPSPAVRAAIAGVADGAGRYVVPAALRDAIAAHAGVPAEQVVATNGSDELCTLLATLLLEPGARVVVGDPCYAIDALASAFAGAEVVRVPLAADGGHDVEALIAAAAAAGSARLLWLPSPHNPTGATTDAARLGDLLRALPDTTVVLDEAYRDFADPARRPDATALLREHPNFVVQRTLSKAHALAGLRVGYGLARPDLVDALNTIRPPFNVNVAAQAAAAAALADTAWADYGVRLVVRERERLEAFLRDRGVEHVPSQANFVLVRPADPAALHAALAARGIAIRDGADLGAPGHVRITIGAPPRMLLVREALEETA